MNQKRKRKLQNRKYKHQFDTKYNITVICTKVRNELYRLRPPRRKEKV
jgi:hypothetical protein